MPENTVQAPLWLDIKPQYIDENFDRVVDYLHSQSAKADDSFYKATIDLMEKRIEELLLEQYHMPLSREESLSVQEHTYAVRLLAVYLLLGTERCARDAAWFAGIYILMLKNLIPLASKDVSTDFISLAIEALGGKISAKMPYGWSDVRNFVPDIFSHKIIHLASRRPVACGAGYQNRGVMDLKDGRVEIIPFTAQAAARIPVYPSITAFDEKFVLLSGKDDRLKQADIGNIDALGDFTRRFVTRQRTAVTPVTRLKVYDENDIFEVRVVSKEGFKVKLQSIDKAYEPVTGYLACESLCKLGYTDSDFYYNLEVDDIIKAKRGRGSLLDISDDVKSFIAEECAPVGGEFSAVVTLMQPDSRGLDKVYMWTSEGFPVQCFRNQSEVDDLEVGDCVNVHVTSLGKDNYYGVVNVKITGMSDKEVDRDEAVGMLVEKMVYDTYTEEQTPLDMAIAPVSIKAVAAMLVRHQRALPQPSERYRVLCVARVLAELIDSREDSDFIAYLSAYLENLVHFAKGNYDKLEPLRPSAEFTGEETVVRRMQIVDILRAYGNDSYNDLLEEIIKEGKDPLLHKIAILVQSCNRIDDVISKAMQNVIKREITKNLAVETEGETDLEEENGSYLGIENSRQEFKTSFFYAPSNSKEQRQEVNIFKGVCAFLNSQAGGTLYIGVNDLGYVNGIDSDLEYMRKNVYGAYSGIDGYMRYITDRAKHYFGLGVAAHIEIGPLYGNQVVALNVKPYEYSIVELEGNAYLRLNNESVIMTEAMKRQALGKRIYTNKDAAANVSILKEAIADCRKVVLKNYSSSNSSTISDRHVEPYAFTENYRHVWCYDLDKQANKVFSTARIGNVQILEEKFTCAAQHKAGNLDIFGMAGYTPIPVSLELDMMARNILLEEYPQARRFIKAADTPHKWIFTTDVYRIEGIGRFYIGLAGHIRIIDAPQLREYAKEYKKHI